MGKVLEAKERKEMVFKCLLCKNDSFWVDENGIYEHLRDFHGFSHEKAVKAIKEAKKK